MEFVTAALALVRREITRLFANQGPSAAPYVISRDGARTVTGSINASDPESDPLSYAVVDGPEAGFGPGRCRRIVHLCGRAMSWRPPAARTVCRGA